MKTELSKEEILELEQQLSCPSGQLWIKIGDQMHKSNITMTLNSLEELDIKSKNCILEIGHGNCKHLDDIINIVPDISYFGLETSELMLKEAQKNNLGRQAEFWLYDGETIPYPDEFFDRVFSVNSIYFWFNPEKLIGEIQRTLKINGLCVLTYANKNFMEQLPFVGKKFQLFDGSDIIQLVINSKLRIIEMKEFVEKVEAKSGEKVERKYTVVQLKKDE